MQNVVVAEPYRFVPPYKGKIWATLVQRWLPTYLRRSYGIESVEFRGLAHLETSLSANLGVALTPNHCRPCDPMVMGLLSKEVGRHFYFMASWHLFMQGRFQAWLINRAGAFSVYREGLDREAIRAAAGLLAEGRRPLVLFPEGVITRTNDLLRPFMEGIFIIARAAAKERTKLKKPATVVIHPVAVKYFLLTDVEASLHEVLDKIEARFTWRKRALPLVDRIVKVGQALLGLKELEFFGSVRTDEIAPRLEALIEHLLGRLEAKWLNGKRQPTFIGRVKALRRALLEEMIAGDISPEEREARWQDLADIYLASQISCYPPDYVRRKPTPERLAETVERFEEDLADKARIHGRWRVIIQIGEAIEIGPERNSADEGLTDQLQAQVQAMIDQINRESESVR